MASDGLVTRMGRPPRPDPKTLARGWLYEELMNRGMSAAEIAEHDGINPSEVYRSKKVARKNTVGPEAIDRPALADRGDVEPRSPRRLSLRAVRSRAEDYADRRPIMTLGVAEDNFWVRLVVAIHADGDGFRLGIGTPGCRYTTRAELASLVYAGHFHAGDLIDVDGWLAKLFKRGRLLDLDDGDIGIPSGLGLVPGETARGQPVRRRASVHQVPIDADPALPFPLQLGKSEHPRSAENGFVNSEESRLFSEKSPTFFRGESGLSSEASGLACAVDVDVIVKENPNTNNNNNSSSRADDSEKSRSKLSEESRSGRDGVTLPPRSQSAALTDELLALAKLNRRRRGSELGLVRGWLRVTAENGWNTEDTVELIKETIGNTMELVADRSLGAPNSLHYFDAEMMTVFAQAVRPPSAPGLTSKPAENRPKSKGAGGLRPGVPAPQARPPLSPEDKAIDGLIDPAIEAWRNDLDGCPLPPSPESFKSAIANKLGELAYLWVEVWTAWDQAGRPAARKPPPFSDIAKPYFAARLSECKEGLSAPDDPSDC